MQKEQEILIGKKLQQARKKERMTLRDVSELTGIPVSTISKMENGVVTKAFKTVQKITDALGIAIEDLENPNLFSPFSNVISIGISKHVKIPEFHIQNVKVSVEDSDIDLLQKLREGKYNFIFTLKAKKDYSLIETIRVARLLYKIDILTLRKRKDEFRPQSVVFRNFLNDLIISFQNKVDWGDHSLLFYPEWVF